MKQTVKLNENQLRQKIVEAINEIGNTPSGQKALGALYQRKHMQGDRETAYNINDYAMNVRDKTSNGDTKLRRNLSHAFETGADDEWYKAGEPTVKLNESQLRQVIKESIKKVLKESETSLFNDGI